MIKFFQPDRAIRIVLSLLTAFLLWYSVKLVQDYTAVLKIPVRFDNPSTNQKLAAPLPNHLELTVSGKGRELFWPSINLWPDTVAINLARYKSSRYIKTDQHLSDIANQLPSDFRILQISPDTIPLFYVKKITRKTPIQSRIKVQTKHGYLLSDSITFKPNEIELKGTPADLDKHTSWPSEAIELKDVNRNRYIVVHFEGDSAIDVEPEKALATIPVERYTEGETRVRIKIVNPLSGQNVRIYPREVTVKYLAPFASVEKVKAEDFVVQIDLQNLDPTANVARLVVKKKSKLARNVRVEPPFVHFILNDEN